MTREEKPSDRTERTIGIGELWWRLGAFGGALCVIDRVLRVAIADAAALLAALFVLLSAVVAVLVLIGLLLGRVPPRELAKVVIGAGLVLAPAMFGWPLERIGFAHVAWNAAPLVDAIDRYTRDHGAPPDHLEALVPRYLSAVPWTGLVAFRSFEYDVCEPRRCAGDTPWELRVLVSRGMINWDVLVYWPTHEYPEQMHGGVVQRMGDWAYVHE